MKKTKRGFTLIELLVVVLIIGILSAIALPQYQKAVTKVRYSTVMPLVESIYQAQKAYYLANGKYAPDFNSLDVQLPGDFTDAGATGLNGNSVSKSNGNIWCYLSTGSVTDPNWQPFYVACQISKPIWVYYRHDFTGQRYCAAERNSEQGLAFCKSLTNKTTRSGDWGSTDLFLFD